MSYRMCDSCKTVINNRVYKKDNCPNCNSINMANPNENNDEWNIIYKLQNENNLFKAIFEKMFINYLDSSISHDDTYIFMIESTKKALNLDKLSIEKASKEYNRIINKYKD